ncbi:hypothetical protein ACTQVS_05535, partial [Anaerovoracaceae bacterium HCP3S3_H6]
LHGIFTIYSNFTPHTRIYFCKAESFLLNWNLLFQFTISPKSSFSVNPFLQICRNSNFQPVPPIYFHAKSSFSLKKRELLFCRRFFLPLNRPFYGISPKVVHAILPFCPF